MGFPVSPDVLVCVCCNSTPAGGRLPRQWTHDDAHVLVREVPCSGKVDAKYLLRVLEGGGSGLCIVTCPEGECQLAQGNYRAEVRAKMIQRLLEEIGLEPGRVELVRRSADATFQEFEQLIRDSVQRICTLGKTPVCAEA